MRPWLIDADAIHGDPEGMTAIVKNGAVNRFLSSPLNEAPLFVVAPKGTGKTLLLRQRSYNLRREHPGAEFLPRKELCEKMPKNVYRRSDDWAGRRDLTGWVTTWMIVLCCAILRRQDRLPEECRRKFGNATAISDFFVAMLMDRSFGSDTRMLASVLMPELDKITSPFFAFLDNTDEAMDEFLADAPMYDEESSWSSQKVWINAQIGLMEAAKAIGQRNSHIHIFSSIRLEAFANNDAITALQFAQYVVHLAYSESDLRAIFEENISNMEEENLVKPKSENRMEQFLGRKRIPHAHAVDARGRSIVEDCFSYIYRHSFGRPRDLMVIGERLDRLKAYERRQLDLVRHCVNEASLDIFAAYRRSLVPHWNKDAFEMFSQRISSNILTREEIVAISKEIGEGAAEEHFFCRLYDQGLIGAVRANLKGRLIQEFRPASVFVIGQPGNLPTVSKYVLHPVVTKLVENARNGHISNSRNVVGYGRAFSEPGSARKGAPRGPQRPRR